MSLNIYKAGLYENTLDVDIAVPKYKSYTYTEKDKIDIEYSEKIPLLFINNTNSVLKYTRGDLFINDKKYDVSLLNIFDVFNILSENNIEVFVIEDCREFLSLPATFLSDFTNNIIQTIDGDISPYNFEYVPKNKTIYSTDSIIKNVHIIDNSNDTEVSYSIIEKDIFYTVGSDTKIYLNSFDTSFYILGSFNSKIICNGNYIANIQERLSDY